MLLESIQETGGIRGYGNQSDRGWPWARHWISHETRADGSSFGACLPTCYSSGHDQELVSGLGLDVESDVQQLLNIFWPCGQTRNPVCSISSALPLDSERKLFASWKRRRAQSFFYVIVSNRCPFSLCVRLLLSWIQLKSSRWHLVEGTPENIDVFHRESTSEMNNIIIITGGVVFYIIATLIWDDDFHTTTAQKWIWSIQMHHPTFGAIAKISTPKKDDLLGLDKSDGQP